MAQNRSKAPTKSRRPKLADPDTIKFTRANAEFHMQNLLTQLRDVYKGGRLNLDALNKVAHW